MSKTHVEVVVLDGIEKASELLVGAFYVVEKLKDLKDDQEAEKEARKCTLQDNRQRALAK